MAMQEALQQAGTGLRRTVADSVARSPQHHRRDHRRARGNGNGNGSAKPDAERLATFLGWFSIGLGLAEVAAPRTVAQWIGVRDDDRNCGILRAMGLREIASGVGILTRPQPAGWVWSRVGGDVMDLSLLGAALTSDRSQRGRVTAATAAVAGITVLDAFCAEQLSEGSQGGQTGSSTASGGALARLTSLAPSMSRTIHVRKAITIGKPAEELYRFWRNLENLPRVMRYLESVRKIDDRRSHWTAKAPFNRTVEWDAEITEDQANRRLAWRSLPGADVDNEGSVEFERAPGGRGTVVHVELRYDPPGGVVGATIAKLFGKEPSQQVQEDLRAFKQVMEVGEVVLSDSTAKGWGAAQPPTDGNTAAARS